MLETVHDAIALFVHVVTAAGSGWLLHLLTSKNSDWQASRFDSSLIPVHSLSFLTIFWPLLSCSSPPAASTSVTSLTARPSSAEVWIITTRLLIVPVRSASGTTVNDGT